jgi:hypothetical protein
MDNQDPQSQVVPVSIHSIPPLDNFVESQEKEEIFPGYYNKHKGISTKKILHMYFDQGRPPSEIAKLLGIKPQTVWYHLKPFRDTLLPKSQLDSLREKKADLLDGAVYTLLSDCLDPSKREAASLNNSAYALKQIHEISRLETDQSTSNQAISMRMDPSSSRGLNRASRRHRLKMVGDPSSDSRVLEGSDEG